ncbi:hypothetical protein D3C76_1305650 [compost metagenome]
MTGCFIPANNVAAAIRNNGGTILELLQYFLQGRMELVRLFLTDMQFGVMLHGKGEQVLAFIRGQFECGSYVIQHRMGYLNIPSLFQPGVPSRAYARQLGDLFSS